MSLCRRLSQECLSGDSSFTTDNKTFHVFLSFRGPDTRHGFVSQLYSALEGAGVSTFLDEKSLQKGEYIRESLLQGIRASRICIPVFSKGFAQSPWCLKEVLHMVKSKAKICPLFYDVLPSPDVRHPDQGEFAKDLEAHKSTQKLSPELIEECKSALRDVSHICGWSRNQFPSDPDLIRRVLRDVMKELGIQSPVYLHTPKCFGLEWPLEYVKGLLRLGDPQKKMVKVGIHGMPGIGKTTLAKVVYKEIRSQFDAACFVLGVRERLTQDANGLAKLQQQVLHDLLDLEQKVDHVDRGRSLIEDRLMGRNVLLLLDDIESQDQLEALGGNYSDFGEGSRLLITSRNLQILKQVEVDETYEVGKLQHKHALDLFNFHAMSSFFCQDQELQTLCNRIVNSCEGHPLTLEAVGRNLQGERDKNVWTDMVEKLWREPTIEGKLKTCYDTLDSHEKELFQDIACFFLWMDKETVIIFWKELRLSPHASLRHLFQKSCISFGPNHELLMHSSWQALGRSLAKGKRLFSEEDVQQIFWEPKEKAAEVRYLSYEPKKKKTLKVKKFKSMRNLQLLWLTDVVLEGQFSEACFHDLRWLRWRRCSSKCLPPDMNLSRLAILQLTDGHLTHIWDERSQDYLDLLPAEIKAMILSGCVFLESLPASLTYTHLQILDLENCKSLRSLPNSVGNFKSLVSLNMKGCGISILPDDFGDLSILQKLNLSWCDHLCELPSSFGNLTLLQELQIQHNPMLTKLPESFGGLKALELLNMSWCDNLCELPFSFGNLTLLQELQIHHNPMLTKLPQSFGGLKALELLNLSWCDHLCELPSSFGNLTLLQELQIQHNPMLTRLPEDFGGLKALEFLNASYCRLSEDGLPPGMFELYQLKIMHLEHNKLRRLHEALKHLSQLLELHLDGCKELFQLPALPPSLKLLYIRDCTSLHKLCSLSELTSLRRLDARNSHLLQDLPGLESLQSLTRLDLRGCPNISYATLGNCLTGLQSLETLFIGGPGVSAMKLQDFYDSIQKLSFHEGCLVHPSQILSSKWRTAEAGGMHGNEILCIDRTLDDNLSYCAGYIVCSLVHGQGFLKNEYCEPSIEDEDGDMGYNCKYLDRTNRLRYTIERDAESPPCKVRHPKTTTGGAVLELSVVRAEGDPEFGGNEWLRTGSKLRVKAASDYENWKACFKFLTYEPPLHLIPPEAVAPKSAISITFGV